ncbi:hypothetical protein [Actinocrispum sp. NPDC049592]|uniref:hypothetical protein n=1 Tax=Actinocrispum sp. NPDC049592 TaxID=3154835 RepID=UPI0034208B7B
MCGGEGVLRWRQPCPDGVLREMEHPCPNGCGTSWKLPAAQQDKVIAAADQDELPERRRGRADEANTLGGEFVGRALRAWGFQDD